MANIRVYREEGNSAGHILRLTLRVAIGAIGAPGTYAQSWGFGSTPLTRTGVGVYTVSLADWFPSGTLMGYEANTIQGTIAAGDGTCGIITAENYSTAGTSPTVTLTMTATGGAGAGLAAEIRSGATLLLELAFKNTSQAF